MKYATVASAQDGVRRAKESVARAEQAASDRAVAVAGGYKALGSSDEERKRVLASAVANDPTVLDARDALLDAESALGAAQAVIDDWHAERRVGEWAIRQRLADALAAIGQRMAADFGDAAAFDAALDEVTDVVVTRAARNGSVPF